MKSISFTGMLKTDIISKKMNEAIAVITFASDGQKETEILEGKIVNVLKLVQSIRLQSPSTHSGPVIAYSSISDMPFPTDAGIIFSWFRAREVGGNTEMTRLDHHSSSFYMPTIDDIGYKICVQFEDEYDQGLSRHLEVSRIIP